MIRACAAAAFVSAASAQEVCTVDLTLAGGMKDVVWNALVDGLEQPDDDVAAFMGGAESRYADGAALLAASAVRFEIEEAVLSAEVEVYRHCNCTHGEAGSVDDAVSAFARDVTMHVVLHETAHALIREFDLPVLANEETAADAFATYYLTTYMPDRAVDVLTARTRSLMIEAAESTDEDWGGEHNHDARRAHQIAAMAVAADSDKYAGVAAVVGMSDEDIRSARDYGAEIHRSWRRVLAPLLMPAGQASSEARVTCEDSAFLRSLCADGWAAEVEAAVRRFDWHSQVTIQFVEGDGGAGWSRSRRTVTVNSAYVRRFVEQGRSVK